MSSCKGTAVFIVTITALFALVLPFITYVACNLQDTASFLTINLFRCNFFSFAPFSFYKMFL